MKVSVPASRKNDPDQVAASRPICLLTSDGTLSSSANVLVSQQFFLGEAGALLIVGKTWNTKKHVPFDVPYLLRCVHHPEVR